MTYMSDANQEIKKDSKTKKKTKIDSLEGFLFFLIFFLFGIIGELIIGIPIVIILLLVRKYGNEKIELISVILSYIIVILLFIWIMYLKYTYTSELLSTGAQNP
jgi:energy-coupling factor transporter transmembrane protein EcfT